MKHLFFGGVHPKYNKEMSLNVESHKFVTPDQVIIPMVQHIGVACQPLVEVGQRVLLGQKIGDGEGLCVPVHSSVSGTVIAIEDRPHISGRMVLSVVIQNDFQGEAATDEPADWTALEDDEILHRIREAGVVGMGGAAFPGSVKAVAAMGSVDTLIANACECEPYITADDCLLRTAAENVLIGMEILRKVLHPQRAVLAVEDNKQVAIELIRQQLPQYPNIELKVLPTRYPQGAEKQLIQAITGREVLPGKLPVSVGCAVFNVSTYNAIARAVIEGKALTQRFITVTGEMIQEPQNFIVPIGTPVRKLIQAAGGLHIDTDRIIAGGPMMGTAIADLDAPVVKATNSILCLPKDKNGAAENPVCLRCGKCVAACPMRLQPLFLYRYHDHPRHLKRLHLMDCMECGCCAYTCPGKLPLVESFRKSKAFLRAKEAEEK